MCSVSEPKGNTRPSYLFLEAYISFFSRLRGALRARLGCVWAWARRGQSWAAPRAISSSRRGRASSGPPRLLHGSRVGGALRLSAAKLSFETWRKAEVCLLLELPKESAGAGPRSFRHFSPESSYKGLFPERNRVRWVSEFNCNFCLGKISFKSEIAPYVVKAGVETPNKLHHRNPRAEHVFPERVRRNFVGRLKLVWDVLPTVCLLIPEYHSSYRS